MAIVKRWVVPWAPIASVYARSAATVGKTCIHLNFKRCRPYFRAFFFLIYCPLSLLCSDIGELFELLGVGRALYITRTTATVRVSETVCKAMCVLLHRNEMKPKWQIEHYWHFGEKTLLPRFLRVAARLSAPWDCLKRSYRLSTETAHARLTSVPSKPVSKETFLVKSMELMSSDKWTCVYPKV